MKEERHERKEKGKRRCVWRGGKGQGNSGPKAKEAKPLGATWGNLPLSGVGEARYVRIRLKRPQWILNVLRPLRAGVKPAQAPTISASLNPRLAQAYSVRCGLRRLRLKRGKPLALCSLWAGISKARHSGKREVIDWGLPHAYLGMKPKSPGVRHLKVSSGEASNKKNIQCRTDS